MISVCMTIQLCGSKCHLVLILICTKEKCDGMKVACDAAWCFGMMPDAKQDMCTDEEAEQKI